MSNSLSQLQPLLSTITSQLNTFFTEISPKGFHFEYAKSVPKKDEDIKVKLLKKAFRIFKKKLSKELDDLSEKEKERMLLKSWEKLSEDDKLRYLDGPKLCEKKGKRKRDDQAFNPGDDL